MFSRLDGLCASAYVCLSSRSKQRQNEEILMRLPKRLGQSERKEVRSEERRRSTIAMEPANGETEISPSRMGKIKLH